MIVGIDFGTCFSCIAIMKGFNPITTYIKDTTQEGIPSRFMYSKESGKELYGIDTMTGEAFKDYRNLIKNMKTLVREDPENLKKKIPGHEYILSEVIEKFLTYLITLAKNGAARSGEFDNSNIDDITVTVPAGIAQGDSLATDYNNLIRESVKKVTGLSDEHVRVLQEPVAASVSYLYGENLRTHYDSKQTILVCDLGGGTFDVTITEFDPHSMKYSIIDTDGDLHLGGNDWDAKLAESVLKKIGIEEVNDDEKIDFEEQVTKLKIELSKTDESMIFFKHDDTMVFTEYTRSEFEEASKELLERLLSVVKKILNRYKPGINGIDKVVLVGGGSNMPQVREGIMSLLPEYDPDNIIQHDPSTAIAKGAAIYAMLKSNTGGVGDTGEVIDVVSHTYGFECRDSATNKFRIRNVILKGTSFEGKDRIVEIADSTFHAISDDQNIVAYTVYESDYVPTGDSDRGREWSDFSEDAVTNGMVVDINVPAEYYGRARSYNMTVEMALDTNGILEMTIRDKAGNNVGYVTNYKNTRKPRDE